MSVTVGVPRKVWSEADLTALPDDGYNHEIVNGELVMSPKNNFQHGGICVRVLSALNAFVQSQRLGVVLDSSTGFWMANRNCRAPDISFVAKSRLKGLKRPLTTFFQGAPIWQWKSWRLRLLPARSRNAWPISLTAGHGSLGSST